MGVHLLYRTRKFSQFEHETEHQYLTKTHCALSSSDALFFSLKCDSPISFDQWLKSPLYANMPLVEQPEVDERHEHYQLPDAVISWLHSSILVRTSCPESDKDSALISDLFMANAWLQDTVRHCIHTVLDRKEVQEVKLEHLNEIEEVTFEKRLEDCRTSKSMSATKTHARWPCSRNTECGNHVSSDY